MFGKFKNLSRLLSFILIFNFIVLNFGIKPKEAHAAIIDISSARVINYDLRSDGPYLIFDFSKYLSGDEKIDSFVLKKGKDKIDAEAVGGDKKAWKVRIVPLNGEKYEINVTANLGGQQRKLLYEFVYNDFETKYRPNLNFKGENLEIEFNKEWLNLFNDEDIIKVQIPRIINEDIKVKDLKSSNKKVWDNKKSSFKDFGGDILDVTVNGRPYRWKIFINNTYQDQKMFGMMSVELKSYKFVKDQELEVEVTILDDNIKLEPGDKMGDVGSQIDISDIKKKTGKFKVWFNVGAEFTIRLDQKSGKKYESFLKTCSLKMIEKLNFKSSVSDTSNSIDIDLTGMGNFMSKTASKNKLVIYESDNFTKGKKLGEKTGAVNGVNTINISNEFGRAKTYLVELTNGTYTISAPFVYTSVDVKTSEVTETSVKVDWAYPNGYTPSQDDKIEIFLRDKENTSYSSIPNAVLSHGGSINLSSKTSEVINGLAPGTNYEVKVVLNNQRGSIENYGDFSTKPFVLTKPIEIKDPYYDDSEYKIAHPRSKKITVQWDFQPANMRFSPNDKVEIWVKPNTTGAFSGYPKTSDFNNPAFVRTEDLNNIKSAEITLPRWMEEFHVDLIYTIGGKKIITPKKSEYKEDSFNRRTVQAGVDKPSLKVEDTTQTTAKIKWEYDKGSIEGSKKNKPYKPYEPEKGHIVEVHVKKVSSTNDFTQSGFDDNNRKLKVEYPELLKKKELDLTGLDVDQAYRVRVRHTLEEGKYVEEFFNFQTGSFRIENLTAKQEGETPKVKLTWGTSDTPQFGNGESEKDNIKVYIKERSTSEYKPVDGEVEDYTPPSAREENAEEEKPKQTKQCDIELPKYNTPYDIKLEYTLKGKKIEEYTFAEARGELSVNVSDVKKDDQSKWSAQVNLTCPTGYTTKRDKDKIKLTVQERGAQAASPPSGPAITRDLPNGVEITITSGSGSKKLEELKENKDYDVKVEFENDGKVVHTAETSFKVTSDLQIVGLTMSDVKAKTAKISWDYTPNKEFKGESGKEDKVEIFIKDITGTKKTKAPADDLKEYRKIYTAKHTSTPTRSGDYGISLLADDEEHSDHVEESKDLSKFKSLNLTGLGVNKEYSIKVKYSYKETTDSGDVDKTSEVSEVTFKTLVDKFNATVFSSNQTSATYGWEYPPGYELEDGDKIEIFVKEVPETGKTKTKRDDDGIGTEYKSPLLTLTHKKNGGDEENGEYDLTGITKVDISGLTPEKKYKSEIKFTMGKEASAHTIKTEVDISTESFKITSFEVDSYEGYDILVKWEIEPQDMVFNEADNLKIFVKLESEEKYDENDYYQLTTVENDDGKTISNTFSDYVEAAAVGEKQDIKLVYTIGEKTYDYEIKGFDYKIDPLKAEVISIDETRALIEITTPQNYEFVDEEDRLLIYSKDKFSDADNIEDENFLVFEGIQSDEVSIADDMRLIELSYLLPEAEYDVLVKLDLAEGNVEPVRLKFETKPVPITELKLESINYDGGTISWDYGENEIDFFDDGNDNTADKLLVGVKESDGTPVPDKFDSIREIAVEEHTGEDIANVKDARIEVEDKTKDYDVVICCDIGGLSYIKQSKLSFLSVSVDEESITRDFASINWKYPSNITFGDNDKTDIFLRMKDEPDYPESPMNSFNGSGITSCDLEGLEGDTEYIVKVQITKEGLKIDPVEVEFTTQPNAPSDVVIEDLDYEVTGTAAEFTIPDLENIEIDTGQSIGLVMGNEPYQGFSITFNDDGTGFVIQPTIPKKKYENIEVKIPLKDGSEYTMVIKEFTTQPADIAQDWLSNAYWFAFERFPDEEGYGYWYGRMKEKKLNGEYFLKNLMFAEDEFTNRNLADRDLIAALYQIVVNREYDEGGLTFWIGIYNENLQNAQGNKKLAQETLVDRMVHEPEFGKLCDKVGIFWRQSDQDAAGVPS